MDDGGAKMMDVYQWLVFRIDWGCAAAAAWIAEGATLASRAENVYLKSMQIKSILVILSYEFLLYLWHRGRVL
jgi:hypothetical protein